jgi:hypothetical protein
MRIIRMLAAALASCLLSVPVVAQVSTTVVEYYNIGLDAYFITGRANEQSLLDTGVGFQRTGMTFRATTALTAPASLTPICRYYISLSNPFTSSHFYGAKGSDCELIEALRPVGFSSDGFDFATERFTALGFCPSSAPYPVYRAYRAAANGKTPNHRYSTSLSSYTAQVNQGWTGEGITFCVSSVTDVGAPAVVSSAVGYWSGTINNGRNVYAIIAPSGESWVMYTDAFGRNVLAGVLYAQVSWANGLWSTSAGRDFNFEQRIYADARTTGAYTTRSRISGTTFYPAYNQSNTFTGIYQAEYDLTPSLPNVAGNYSGSVVTLLGSEAASVSIQNNGAVSGLTAGGCRFLGTLTPMSGVNLYRTSVTLQGGNCGSNLTVVGASFYDSLSRSLNVITLDNSRTTAYVYLGTKR